MTIDEAIFCMTSYLPDSDDYMCRECPYYGSVPYKGVFVCRSSEAHKLAIKALKEVKKMKESRKRTILDCYERFDSDDISTERLLAMVADECGCDVSDVVDVLYEEHREKKE